MLRFFMVHCVYVYCCKFSRVCRSALQRFGSLQPAIRRLTHEDCGVITISAVDISWHAIIAFYWIQRDFWEKSSVSRKINRSGWNFAHAYRTTVCKCWP